MKNDKNPQSYLIPEYGYNLGEAAEIISTGTNAFHHKDDLYQKALKKEIRICFSAPNTTWLERQGMYSALCDPVSCFIFKPLAKDKWIPYSKVIRFGDNKRQLCPILSVNELQRIGSGFANDEKEIEIIPIQMYAITAATKEIILVARVTPFYAPTEPIEKYNEMIKWLKNEGLPTYSRIALSDQSKSIKMIHPSEGDLILYKTNMSVKFKINQLFIPEVEVRRYINLNKIKEPDWMNLSVGLHSAGREMLELLEQYYIRNSYLPKNLRILRQWINVNNISEDTKNLTTNNASRTFNKIMEKIRKLG